MVADSAVGASPAEPRPPRGRQDETILREYTRPVAFYVWATALPWAFWFAAAYLSHLPEQSQAVLVSTLMLSLAGLFSPLAVVVAFIWNRPRLRADIVTRLKWPGADRFPWVLAAVLLVPVSLLAAQGVSLFFGYGLDQFSLRGGFTFSTGLMPAWATLIGAAIIEELAWHSYGTDTLVRKMRVFSASMLFTLIWALWHVPLSFIDGYYQNEVVESGVLATLNFPISMIAFVLVMNWLYYRCGRSILVPVIFHASANMSAELFMTHPDSKLIQTGVLLIFSAVIVIRDRSLFFDRPAVAPELSQDDASADG
jgi:membrane protease YdiL (CAAX protease family)